MNQSFRVVIIFIYLHVHVVNIWNSEQLTFESVFYQFWLLPQHDRKWKGQSIQCCKYSRKPWLAYFSATWNSQDFKLHTKESKKAINNTTLNYNFYTIHIIVTEIYSNLCLLDRFSVHSRSLLVTKTQKNWTNVSRDRWSLPKKLNHVHVHNL